MRSGVIEGRRSGVIVVMGGRVWVIVVMGRGTGVGSVVMRGGIRGVVIIQVYWPSGREDVVRMGRLRGVAEVAGLMRVNGGRYRIVCVA